MPRAVGAAAEHFPTRKGAQVQVPYRPPQNRRSETIVSDLFRCVSRREPNPLFHHSLVDRVHSLNGSVTARTALRTERSCQKAIRSGRPRIPACRTTHFDWIPAAGIARDVNLKRTAATVKDLFRVFSHPLRERLLASHLLSRRMLRGDCRTSHSACTFRAANRTHAPARLDIRGLLPPLVTAFLTTHVHGRCRTCISDNLYPLFFK